MARTLITATVADRTGLITMPALAALDATNNNNFVNTGRQLLEIKNSGASTFTLTIILPSNALPDSQPGANLTFASGGVVYSITASSDILLGPFPPAIYNQSDGTVWINPSNVALQYRLIQLT
jgi:hypothetical protein